MDDVDDVDVDEDVDEVNVDEDEDVGRVLVDVDVDEDVGVDSDLDEMGTRLTVTSVQELKSYVLLVLAGS